MQCDLDLQASNMDFACDTSSYDAHLYQIRIATVREKYLENEIFSRSGNFVDSQGNLERSMQEKVSIMGVWCG